MNVHDYPPPPRISAQQERLMARWRKDKPMTQREAAKQLGCSLNRFRLELLGKQQMPPERLAAVAALWA